MAKISVALIGIAVSVLCGSSARAQEGDAAAGRVFAVSRCTECHDVGGSGGSRAKPSDAPSFEAIATALTTTPLGLEVFLTTPHASMPNFMIAKEDRANVIAYIMDLRAKAKRVGTH